jgi:hypothetical protein
LKPIRVLSNNELITGYLVTDEVSIVFNNRCVWLVNVKEVENADVFETVSPMSLLGEQKLTDDLEGYAWKIFKLLKTTSLLDYIVQKHFYSDQDINFDIT